MSLLAIDIAQAAHNLCTEILIPKGISQEHEVMQHIETSGWYADAINNSGLEVTQYEVVTAIIMVTNWDMNSPWPGHPAPDLVLNYLRGVV